MTIKEIADSVGVSSTTVSRVLNFDGSFAVTEKTRQAIIEAAEAMNYATPRTRNRPLRHSSLGKLALVHSLRPEQELIDPYFVGVRLGIESRCQSLKIETVKVYHTASMPDPKLLQDAGGAIAIGYHSEAEIDWLLQYSRHLVFADFQPESYDVDSVESDLGLAMRKLLDALTDAGYSRIAFAGYLDPAVPGEKRRAAYTAWMHQRDRFDPGLCLTDSDNTEQSGYRIARQLLATAGVRPEVIVTCNDNMAVGAYRAAGELGIDVPHEVAIASFNDISVAQFLNPPLTTVHLPSEEIGETAVDLLVERVGGREIAKTIKLATRIIWRGSTKAWSQDPLP